MNERQLYVYVDEILLHAQLAYSNYITFRNLVGDPHARQRREAWMFMQSFLSHLGMVSKLLFAPSARTAESRARAAELRVCLGVTVDSALNDRDARNAVEHLDERLDYWLSQEDKGILESVFESRTEFAFLDPNRYVIRRVYLVEEDAFISQGPDGHREAPFGVLVEELSRVMQACQRQLGERDPYVRLNPRNG
jgi:hypothetical protein